MIVNGLKANAAALRLARRTAVEAAVIFVLMKAPVKVQVDPVERGP